MKNSWQQTVPYYCLPPGFALEFTILALSRTLSVLATLYKRLAVNFAKDLFTFQLTKTFNNCLTSKAPILRSSAVAHGKQKASFSFRVLLGLQQRVSSLSRDS